MKYEHLTTFSQAAKELGVDRKTIGDLVRLHKIETFPVPTNGKARGVNVAGMKRLRKLLPVATA